MAEYVTIYFSDDGEKELDAFDRVANRNKDRMNYSRSKAIKDSMDMNQLVMETLEEIDAPEDMSKEDREAFVEQALLEFGQSDEG